MHEHTYIHLLGPECIPPFIPDTLPPRSPESRDLAHGSTRCPTRLRRAALARGGPHRAVATTTAAAAAASYDERVPALPHAQPAAGLECAPAARAPRHHAARAAASWRPTRSVLTRDMTRNDGLCADAPPCVAGLALDLPSSQGQPTKMELGRGPRRTSRQWEHLVKTRKWVKCAQAMTRMPLSPASPPRSAHKLFRCAPLFVADRLRRCRRGETPRGASSSEAVRAVGRMGTTGRRILRRVAPACHLFHSFRHVRLR